MIDLIKTTDVNEAYKLALEETSTSEDPNVSIGGYTDEGAMGQGIEVPLDAADARHLVMIQEHEKEMEEDRKEGQPFTAN